MHSLENRKKSPPRITTPVPALFIVSSSSSICSTACSYTQNSSAAHSALGYVCACVCVSVNMYMRDRKGRWRRVIAVVDVQQGDDYLQRASVQMRTQQQHQRVRRGIVCEMTTALEKRRIIKKCTQCFVKSGRHWRRWSLANVCA